MSQSAIRTTAQRKQNRYIWTYSTVPKQSTIISSLRGIWFSDDVNKHISEPSIITKHNIEDKTNAKGRAK